MEKKIIVENGEELVAFSIKDLKENNLRTKRLTEAIYIGYAVLILILVLGFIFMDYFNIIDYIAFKINNQC